MDSKPLTWQEVLNTPEYFATACVIAIIIAAFIVVLYKLAKHI